MLNLLLLDDMKAFDKCRKLEMDFGIAMYEELPKEVLEMCDLSEVFYERGVDAKSMDTARNLLTMNVLTHEQIAQAVGLPLDKVEELARQSESSVPDTVRA